MPVEEQEQILGGMHEAYDEALTGEMLLDVRVIAPATATSLSSTPTPPSSPTRPSS